MRRNGRVAVATVVGLLASTLVWASPAAAAPSITVTPNAGLKVSSLAHVEGTGFPAGVTVFVCEGVVNGSPTSDDCDPDFRNLPGTDSSGAFAVDVLVAANVTIPSLQRAVDCRIETCSVIAGVLDDFDATAAFAPMSFAPGQPDGRIKRRSDGVILGDGVRIGPSQGWTHAIAPGGYWTYALQVQNDGPTTDDIEVVSGRPGIFGDVQFFYGYFDVTSSVVGKGFGNGLTFPNMAPGEVRNFAMRFHVGAAAPVGLLVQSSVFFSSKTNEALDDLSMWVVVAP